ncbi:MAG TPA: hypothetical protein ENI39_02045 [Anaerolineae bacterium]|nr:hypothetical protein [Anaerolineae bacterium]
MQERTVLDWITVISSLATPILVLVLSAIFASIGRRQEKLYELQQKLQDDRIRVYDSILEPYIVMATPEEVLHKQERYREKTSGDAASEIITTPEYKQAEFRLFLMGSDEVVRAYNQLKQFYYSGVLDGSQEATKEALTLIAKLVLAIRKSVGNEKTKISYRDAVWWFIKDADKIL